MKTLLHTLLACLAGALMSFSIGAAQLPIPDPGFGDAGGIARIGFDLAGSRGDAASAAVALADGRLILAGTAEVNTQQRDIGFARLSGVNGSLDPGFGPNNDGRALAGLAPVGEVKDILPTANGLLYLATISNATVVIGRRTASGAVDPAFNGNGHRFLGAGFFIDGGNSVVLSRLFELGGGKILVVGYAGSTSRVCAVAVRLHANGSTDSSFGAGSGRICVAPIVQPQQVAGAFNAIVLADERILLAGVSVHSGGSGLDMSVARLAADGALDLNFGPDQDGWAHVGFDQGGSLYDSANAIAVDSGGRIVIAGRVETQTNDEIGVARLLPDGLPDLAFGSGGRVQTGFDVGGWNTSEAHNIFVLPDRHILVGGAAQSNYVVGVALMLHDDGRFENRFGAAGRFVLTDPNGPESGMLKSARTVIDGDYMYMVGSIVSEVLLPGGIRNLDFAATRHVIPLFSGGFDAD